MLQLSVFFSSFPTSTLFALYFGLDNHKTRGCIKLNILEFFHLIILPYKKIKKTYFATLDILRSPD